MSEFRELEQRTFRTARDDGLWDVLVAPFFAMFAIAPLIADRLGDFWSSALFVPVWLVVYLVTRVMRVQVVQPRIGVIELGEERRERMRKGGLVLLAINAVAAVMGVVAWLGIGFGWLGIESAVYPMFFSLTLLLVFSVGAYITRIWRFAVYGLLLAVGPILGEWMWQQGWVDHHGYPVVFGTVALIMLIVGLIRLATVLRSHPMPRDPARA